MTSGRDLRKALKVNDLTMDVAAEKLGISRGTLYNYVNKGELETELIEEIERKLNISFKPSPLPFIEQRRIQKNHEGVFMVPYVDLPAQAGYIRSYDQIDFINKLEKYPILPNVDHRGAEWRYFTISGDSMEPEFREDDVILASLVTREDWPHVRNYHVHVIVTDKDLWIKNIYKESDKEWILISDNEAYDPFIVKLQDIREVWVMRRHVKNRVKKSRMFDMAEIRQRLKK